MQDEYFKRINQALAFIDEHLDGELSLQTISSVACYLPFHLHRLFKAITGETVNAYINKLENWISGTAPSAALPWPRSSRA